MHDAPDRPVHQAGGKPADAGDFVLARRRRLCEPRFGAERGLLVDFGCGNGAQTFTFADQFEKIMGLDVEARFVEEFDRVVADRDLVGRVSARLYPGERIPLDDASADQVVSFTVLEHVPDQVLALNEMFRILKPGGRLIMSVPNTWWVFETHGANLPLLPWNRVPFFSWLPTPLHERWARARIYTRGRITGLLAECGFAVEEVRHVTAPMDVVPWRRLRDWLRRTVFGADAARLPVLATSILLKARRS